MTQIFAQDWAGVDSLKIETRHDPKYGPVTTFLDVVIAREAVQPYKLKGELKRTYKSAAELEQYWPWVEGRWAVAGRHPDTPVVASPEDIAGKTVNSRFIKNLKDPKTGRNNIRGIMVDLEVFNNKVPPAMLAAMKAGDLRDVSIGYLFAAEMTPGTWNGEAYDFKQTNMFHDHTSFGIKKGRCSYPACGLGADEMFKGYSLNGEGNLLDMKKMVSAGDYPPRTEAERAKVHFKLSDDAWAALTDEEKKAYLDKLPPKGAGQDSFCIETWKKDHPDAFKALSEDGRKLLVEMSTADPPVDPPVDPPADPPTDPPTDPPVDPPADPPADPPEDPPADPKPEPVVDEVARSKRLLKDTRLPRESIKV